MWGELELLCIHYKMLRSLQKLNFGRLWSLKHKYKKVGANTFQQLGLKFPRKKWPRGRMLLVRASNRMSIKHRFFKLKNTMVSRPHLACSTIAHAWLLEVCSICGGLGWEPVAETSTDMECWRWQARTFFWLMGCPCDKILQVAEYWGVAGCSPGQSSLAAVPAGFCHIHLCICNIFVRSHPLCPKWAAAPWHTGAKSKVKVLFLDC